MIGNIDKSWPNDETLLAFADGRLDAADTARVEEFLRADPAGKVQVDVLRRSGALAASAFDDALRSPVNQRLVDMIQSHKRMAQTGSTQNVVIMPKWRRFGSETGVRQWALAASLALLIGGLTGYSIGQSPEPNGSAFEVALGHVQRGSLFENALETKVSGDPLTLHNNSVALSVMAVASFRDRLGRPCREFEAMPTQGASVPTTVGVACRTDGGEWVVEGASRLAAAPEGSGGDYSPAGSDDQSTPVAGMTRALGASEPLSVTDEKDLIAKAWK